MKLDLTHALYHVSEKYVLPRVDERYLPWKWHTRKVWMTDSVDTLVLKKCFSLLMSYFIMPLKSFSNVSLSSFCCTLLLLSACLEHFTCSLNFGPSQRGRNQTQRRVLPAAQNRLPISTHGCSVLPCTVVSWEDSNPGCLPRANGIFNYHFQGEPGLYGAGLAYDAAFRRQAVTTGNQK